jgi:hypothetical protein
LVITLHRLELVHTQDESNIQICFLYYPSVSVG